MKKITALCITAAFYVSIAAQKSTGPLTIGGQCPDLTLTGLANLPSGELKLSDYKGKLLILDFMGTNCVSCIAAFPHLSRLQEQFAGKIQVIVVNKNRREDWQKLTQRNKLARELGLPVVWGDSVLTSLFPHEYIPHEVWLDGNRIVKAVTTAQYVTASNIQYILDGKKIDWPVKEDIGNYAFGQPLLSLSEGENISGPVYYSVLTKHRKGTLAASKTTVDSNADWKRYTVINASIIDLYKRTLDPALANAGNRFILETGEPGRFMYNEAAGYRDRWEAQNTYCYETMVPVHTSGRRIREQMQADLNRYLGLNGRVESRKRKSYVLKSRGADSRQAKPVLSSSGQAKQGHLFHSIASLLEACNQYQAVPVIDETGIKGSICIQLTGEAILDVEIAKKELYPYGLELVPAERELEVFVISKNQ